MAMYATVAGAGGWNWNEHPKIQGNKACKVLGNAIE